LHYDRFRELGVAEQAIRVESATTARLAREVEERARDAAMKARMKLVREKSEAVRLVRESDPKGSRQN
jgi:hypothetical protein